jgi:hypothetical protein
MEMCHTRKRFGLIAIATDNTTAITEHADNTTVFPMGSAMLKGKFQYAQEIFNNVYWDLKFDLFLNPKQSLATARFLAGPTTGFYVLPLFTSI